MEVCKVCVHLLSDGLFYRQCLAEALCAAPVPWLQERALPYEVSRQPCRVLTVEGTVGDSVAALRAMASLMRSAQVIVHV